MLPVQGSSRASSACTENTPPLHRLHLPRQQSVPNSRKVLEDYPLAASDTLGVPKVWS